MDLPVSRSGKPHFMVSVRELVDWCHRRGDLWSDRSFSGPQRAVKGIRGHQQIQESRPAGYVAEVPLSRIIEAPSGAYSWLLRGRADGVWPQAGTTLVEEIKTVTPRWKGQPVDTHWAQARIYAAIIAARDHLSSVDIQLTYLEIESGLISVFRDSFSSENLEQFLNEAIAGFQEVLDRKFIWEQEKLASTSQLAFPFTHIRGGQETIMNAMGNILESGGIQYIQAPTGLGKTMAMLYPAVEYSSRFPEALIFFLTARNSNKANAEKALQALRSKGAKIRSVTLGAAADWCHTDNQSGCDMRQCPMAIGYFDRSRQAIIKLLDSCDHWDQSRLREWGMDHQVCPSALSHELVKWADVIVADYNHALDPKAAVRAFFTDDHDRRIILLIDEAHNLPDRARKMFGALLEKNVLTKAQRSLGSHLPECRDALGMTLSQWPVPDSATAEAAADNIPEGFLHAVEKFKSAAEKWLVLNEDSAFRENLLDAWFQVSDFSQTWSNRSGADYLIQDSGRMEILCLDPGPKLEKVFRSVHAVAFFSATLEPADYFEHWLTPGLPSGRVSIPSPYPPDNLKLWIEQSIRTQFRSRKSTASVIARLLIRFVERTPGNHIIFFPSYDYLELIENELTSLTPAGVSILTQQRQSDQEARKAFFNFLESVEPENIHLGMAVLGGIYAEGIDLPHGTLAGLSVVGVGMPQISLERNLIRDHFAEKLGGERAFAYAYIYPGMTRVIQAVGRLIRSESDTGSALLIDPRYCLTEYQSLFPDTWAPHFFTYRTGE